LKLGIFLFFGLLLLGCAHHQRDASSNTLTEKISNADIHWDGNIAGLWPTITGPSKDLLTNSDPRVVRALIGLLTDQNRYIAAHVLLTHISEEQFEFTPGHWNGLRVEILADNVIIVRAGQQTRLIEKWNQWHAKKLKEKN
jgi:hypothetical protein